MRLWPRRYVSRARGAEGDRTWPRCSQCNSVLVIGLKHDCRGPSLEMIRQVVREELDRARRLLQEQ